MGPRDLSVQRHHRRHRARRRAADHRLQSAPRGGGAQRAHPQALARRANSRSALIGEKVDLTYPYDYLGAGPDTLAELAAGKHSFAEMLKSAERPLIIVGAGALARPDGAAVAALAAKAAIELGAVKEGWNGFRVLHTAASRVGALDIGFVPGEGGLDAAAMAKAGALDVLFLLGADEIDVAARRLRRLHRHPWRQRRAPRRRDPAGRGLSGEIRPLRQHRRPRADGQPRQLPARRRARGLGDPARAVGRARRASCPTTRSPRCARRCSRSVRSSPASARSWPSGPADIRQLSATRRAMSTRRRSARSIDDYLSDQSDRARVRGDGRMLGARRGRAPP